MEDEEIRKPQTHAVGMSLEGMSVAELESRIALLQAEIERLRLAVDARDTSRRAAEAAFKM